MSVRSLALAALLSVGAVSAVAQVSNSTSGNVLPTVSATAPLITGTTNSADFSNVYGRGAMCQLHQVSSSGTATITYAIQSKGAASGTYDSLLTSSSITAVTDTFIAVYPGMAVASLPTGWTAQ